MAKDTRSIPNQRIDGQVNYRAWGDAISKCLAAGGLTKASDTGQVDWTTASYPSVNTFTNYEIWKLTTDTKFNDLGLYIKIEYGFSSSTQFSAAIGVTVGTGTDGAGTLTGTVGTRRVLYASTNTSSSIPAYCCANDGQLIAVLPFSAATSAHSNFTLFVERLRNSSGALTSDGIYTFIAGPVAGAQTSYVEIIRSGSLTSGAVTNRFGAFLNNVQGGTLTDFYMSTHHPFDRNQLYNPTLGVMYLYHSDLPAGQTITISRYGTNRTYLVLGQLPTGSLEYPYLNFGHTNGGIAILWE